MSLLKNKRCYLSGPIQYAKEFNWLEQAKKLLRDDLGIDLYLPFEDPKQNMEQELKIAKQNLDYDTITRIVKDFVRKDLQNVDFTHFLVAFLPHGVPTTGTVHEIINSNNAKKPTLLVTDKENISYIPLWYYGFIPKEFMFAGWDSLFTYLKEVDEGKHNNHDRWKFTCGSL